MREMPARHRPSCALSGPMRDLHGLRAAFRGDVELMTVPAGSERIGVRHLFGFARGLRGVRQYQARTNGLCRSHQRPGSIDMERYRLPRAPPRSFARVRGGRGVASSRNAAWTLPRARTLLTPGRTRWPFDVAARPWCRPVWHFPGTQPEIDPRSRRLLPIRPMLEIPTTAWSIQWSYQNDLRPGSSGLTHEPGSVMDAAI